MPRNDAVHFENLERVQKRSEQYNDWHIVATWNTHPLANCAAKAARHTQVPQTFGPPVTQVTGFLETQAGTLEGAISAMKRLIDSL